MDSRYEKYFRGQNYSSEMKSYLAIYNLNGKEAIWWRYLNHTKNDEVKENKWSNFRRIFQEKCVYEIFFDMKVK